MKGVSTFLLTSVPFMAAALDVEIMNTPIGGYRTEYFGGGGGGAFDHYSQDRSAIPDLIRVNSGNRIDQICGRYTDTLNGNVIQKCNGNTNGGQHEFYIDVTNGEYVDSINVAHGDRLDGLQFHTNKNRSSRWYGGGGHLPNRTIAMGENMQLYSLFGRSGREVDSIGFVVGPNCLDIEGREGEWYPVGSTNGIQAYKYYHGTTNSWATETTETFGQTSTTEFSRSFRAKRPNSSSVTVTSQTSHFVAQSAMNEFSTTEKYEREFGFSDAGVVWQWFFESEGICGHSRTKTDHLMLTANGSEPPCCLPTAFFDFHNAHSGGCIGLLGEPVVNLC